MYLLVSNIQLYRSFISQDSSSAVVSRMPARFSAVRVMLKQIMKVHTKQYCKGPMDVVHEQP